MGEAAGQVGWQAKSVFERRMSVTENIPTHHTSIEPMGSLGENNRLQLSFFARCIESVFLR